MVSPARGDVKGVSIVPAKKPKTPDAEKWYALNSVVNGLYNEMDKLAHKAPSSLLSDLATGRVNRAIREAKQFMADFDPYMAELDEFVAAGENPEVRDAVLVLSEIKSGLARLDGEFHLMKEHRGY